MIGGGDIIGGGEGTSQVKNLAKKQQDLIRIDSFSLDKICHAKS